jgi:hypothetical protein
MHLEFAQKAKVAAGDTAAAAHIRHDEMGHRDAFKTALAKVKFLSKNIHLSSIPACSNLLWALHVYLGASLLRKAWCHVTFTNHIVSLRRIVMKHTFHGILLASLALLLTAIPALAHHTIAAEFDTRDTVTL